MLCMVTLIRAQSGRRLDLGKKHKGVKNEKGKTFIYSYERDNRRLASQNVCVLGEQLSM